jgi:hypothetical protein
MPHVDATVKLSSVCASHCVAADLSPQVGVFVSIVSTKIPFKGAGKEYIGDDVEEMVGAVKAAIQQCCAQLRVRHKVSGFVLSRFSGLSWT